MSVDQGLGHRDDDAGLGLVGVGGLSRHLNKTARDNAGQKFSGIVPLPNHSIATR